MQAYNTADTWSCACHLIRLHGDDAVTVALEEMRQRSREGDYQGEDAWYAVAAALSDLQRVRFKGESVH
jgi:hypothetical protein